MEVLSSVKSSFLSGWGGLVDLVLSPSLVSDSDTLKSTEPHIWQLESNPSDAYISSCSVSPNIYIKCFS